MGVTVAKNMGRLTVDDDEDDESSAPQKADSEANTPLQYFSQAGLTLEYTRCEFTYMWRQF